MNAKIVKKRETTTARVKILPDRTIQRSAPGRAHQGWGGPSLPGLLAALGGVWLGLAGPVSVARAQTPPPPSFSISDLGTVVGYACAANAINNSNQVVGSEFAPYVAFAWQDGALTNLGGLGQLDNIAYGINDLGMIVGESNLPFPAFTVHACLWTPGLGPIDLGTLGGESHAFGINNAGQIVGYSFPSQQVFHAFLWQASVGMTDLGTLGGNLSIAYAINNPNAANNFSPQVVGQSTLAGDNTYRAFVWQNNQMIALANLGGIRDLAQALNDNGQIVGFSYFAVDPLNVNNVIYHAVLWPNLTGTIQDLGVLSGDSSSTAWGINNSGQIVGQSINNVSSVARAFLYQNGTMYDLNTLVSNGAGWTLKRAAAINNAGVIVGEGSVGGVDHTFILTPILPGQPPPKISPTITWPNPANITYGTPLSATQLNAVATVSGTTVAGTYVYTPASGAILNPGVQILTVDFTPADPNTYTTASAHVFIGVLPSSLPAPTIVWPPPAAIVYGTPLSSVQLDATLMLNNAAVTGIGTLVYSPTNGAVLDAGIGALTVRFVPNDINAYSPTSAIVPLTVLRKPLSVTANDASRPYGDPNPIFSGTLSGVANNDPISAAYVSAATVSSAATSYGPSSPLAITPTLIDPFARLRNYTVTRQNATLTITPVPLVVTPSTVSKIYGDVFNGFTGTLAGLRNNDNITAAYASTGAAAAAPAGSYAVAATLVDPGNLLGNYLVTINPGTLLVLQAPLTITANDANRLYGSPNPAFTGTITGLRNSDGITATYSCLATPSSPVGAYPIIPAAVDSTPPSLANYTLTLVNGTLTVKPLASVAGFVYLDLNYNGIRDADEPGIADVMLTLTGMDGNGNPVSLTTQTAADGSYSFSLEPGTYSVTETPPENPVYRQAENTVGTVSGVTVGQLVPGLNQFTQIVLNSGDQGVNYNFGALPPVGQVYPNLSGRNCTLTIGYYKNHPTAIVPTPLYLGTGGGNKTLVVPDQPTGVSVESQNVFGKSSNGITKLYAQLLAAKISILAGADNSAVAGVIADADAFLATYNYKDWAGLNASQQALVMNWQSILNSYNNGYIGPGHCD